MNEKFSDILQALEDKWMEKDFISTYIKECGGLLDFVTFRFKEEGGDYYFECELEVEGLDSLPKEVEQKILNEIEWAYDEIYAELDSKGADLEGYLGDKLLLTRVK
jgi:hypothetical protein